MRWILRKTNNRDSLTFCRIQWIHIGIPSRSCRTTNDTVSGRSFLFSKFRSVPRKTRTITRRRLSVSYKLNERKKPPETGSSGLVNVRKMKYYERKCTNTAPKFIFHVIGMWIAEKVVRRQLFHGTKWRNDVNTKNEMKQNGVCCSCGLNSAVKSSLSQWQCRTWSRKGAHKLFQCTQYRVVAGNVSNHSNISRNNHKKMFERYLCSIAEVKRRRFTSDQQHFPCHFVDNRSFGRLICLQREWLTTITIARYAFTLWQWANFAFGKSKHTNKTTKTAL